MERLESHFRLQRQTMGILAQLNEAAVANGIGSNVEGNNPTPAAGAPGENSVDGGGVPTASFSDSGVSSRGGPWASNVLHSIRHFRARRDAFERARSFESRYLERERLPLIYSSFQTKIMFSNKQDCLPAAVWIVFNRHDEWIATSTSEFRLVSARHVRLKMKTVPILTLVMPALPSLIIDLIELRRFHE